jgi:glycosyltransferase involved in cell wall biosynthesis
MRDAAQGAANVELQESSLAPHDMEKLYAETDVVISLHRAEGFGLVPAEAMLRGIPVVATDWPSTKAFLNEETGCPIHYELIPVTDPQGAYDGQMWADPNIEQAAAALRKLRADPEYRMSLKANAARTASALFCPSVYAKEVCSYLTKSEVS